MIKEVKTSWRPLLELTEILLDEEGNVTESGNTFYYNLCLKHQTLSKHHKVLLSSWTTYLFRVKESVKDICKKKIDKIIQAEADRVAEEARKNMEEQAKRMEEYKKANQ